MKGNLIIVGDYNRDDFLYVAKILNTDFNIYFLEYLNESEIKNQNYKQWGKAIFWKDYKNAVELLDIIKPEKVLFYFIESYNQVALNVACKYRGVKTYHIEHGIRNYSLQQNVLFINTQKSGFFQLFQKIFQLKDRFKGRMFFFNTVKQLPETYQHFLKEYYKIRSTNNIFTTFALVNNILRIADCYISFSPKIFEFHKISDHLPDNYPVHFIGCPSFDYLTKFYNEQNSGNDMLFIDNAVENKNLFGWTKENKIIFLGQLIYVSEKVGRKLWIKPHPYSKEEVYENWKNQENIRIIKNEDEFKFSLTQCNIIIGFYSSLLMPLMALPYTTCFALEMHPEPMGYDYSEFLVSSGAVKKIHNWSELIEDIRKVETLHTEQSRNKVIVINNWLYKFDGKSSERMRKVLIDDEAV